MIAWLKPANRPTLQMAPLQFKLFISNPVTVKVITCFCRTQEMIDDAYLVRLDIDHATAGRCTESLQSGSG